MPSAGGVRKPVRKFKVVFNIPTPAQVRSALNREGGSSQCHHSRYQEKSSTEEKASEEEMTDKPDLDTAHKRIAWLEYELSMVEWVTTCCGIEVRHNCPRCGGEKPDHRDGCQLQRVLSPLASN